MKYRKATPKEIAQFEKLSVLPRTTEVMDELGRKLTMDFSTPAKVSLEIAADKLGLNHSLMPIFHTWWAFDRVKAA